MFFFKCKSTQIKTYTVIKIAPQDVKKTITPESPLWERANEITDFIYPWEKEQPQTAILFKALHDGEHLYCYFKVTDKNVKVYVDKNEKKEVVHGDRVEMFLSADENLKNYYCLEVDPLGRVFDYAASLYRKFNENWKWPGQMHKLNIQNNDGYSILYNLSLPSLKQLGLIKNGELRVGLYRGRCMAINLENEQMQWASWVRPDSAKPDFHIPSSFGVFKLE